VHPLTTLNMLTPNQVHTGQTATLLAERQTHQVASLANRRDANQCPVYTWAGPNAVPQNTRHPLRN